MKYVVGEVSLASGGRIFSPGEEIAEADYPSAEAFRLALGRGLVVAENDGGEPAAPGDSGARPPRRRREKAAE